jgi:hypothetical protein
MTATILPFLRGRDRIEIAPGSDPATGARCWLLELVEGDSTRNIVGEYLSQAAAIEAAAAWRASGVQIVGVAI